MMRVGGKETSLPAHPNVYRRDLFISELITDNANSHNKDASQERQPVAEEAAAGGATVHGRKSSSVPHLSFR